jgi:hypothetical protein
VLKTLHCKKINHVTKQSQKSEQRGALRSALHIKYYSGDKINKNKMGWARSMYDVEIRFIQGFGGKI